MQIKTVIDIVQIYCPMIDQISLIKEKEVQYFVIYIIKDFPT